jgi:hypothetical protein
VADSFQLEFGKALRGKLPVSIVVNGEVKLTGKIDPHDKTTFAPLLKKTCKMFPVIRGRENRREFIRQLLQSAASTTRKAASPDSVAHRESPYAYTAAGMFFKKPTNDGGEVMTQLTNFNAKITADTVRDDGAERIHVFEIEATMKGKQSRFQVPAQQFAALNWPIEHLGASAIIMPSTSARDHARVAIQMQSGDVPHREVFLHTGYREIGGKMLYLHGGGAIGADGIVQGIEVCLSDSLAGHTLPAPVDGENLIKAIRASLRILLLAPEQTAFPVVCAIFRAALGPVDTALYLSGPTGVFKSELAALAAQHWGAKNTARSFISWHSTDNAIEGALHSLKDCIGVVDDFAPGGSTHDVQAWHKKADRIIRAQGNGAGRQRMRPDGTLRPSKPPRAMVLATGEDIPRGQSLRARMFIVEIGLNDIDPAILSECQRDAASGLYAQTMASFIRWLIWRVWRASELRGGVESLRELAARESLHRRTPEAVANLSLGLKMFCQFAMHAKALSATEADDLFQRGWNVLGTVASEQATHQHASEPTRRFFELLSSAIASGAAHLANRDGIEPSNAAAWGWRSKPIGNGAYQRDEWQPQGRRIGWIDRDEVVYLDPDASYAVAQAMAAGSDGLTIGASTLRKRLDERGLLIRPDNRDEITQRITLEGAVRRVLQLRSALYLSGEPAKPAKDSDGNGNFGGNGGQHGHKEAGEPEFNPEADQANIDSFAARDTDDLEVYLARDANN